MTTWVFVSEGTRGSTCEYGNVRVRACVCIRVDVSVNEFMCVLVRVSIYVNEYIFVYLYVLTCCTRTEV